MEYTLENVFEKTRQYADKMGSDYFPSGVILNRIETATYDFIDERLEAVELTQKITDDIRNLIKHVKLPIITDPSFPLENRYIAALPSDYLRQVAYDVLYQNGERCRRADMVRQGEKVLALNNPNRQPTKQYPLITQEASLWLIDCGDSIIPSIFHLTYCKKPTFGIVSNLSNRVVNLPDDAIEKILIKTMKLLYHNTDDSRQQGAYQLEETFGKVFK